MFFAGGTFGHESEAREANRRPTGRRHQPRDMAEVQAAINASHGTAPASGATAEGARSVAAQKQMSTGPSFLDRMYEHNADVVDTAHPTRRRGSAPSDHLNIFSWENKAPPAAPGKQASGAPRAARPINATVAPLTAEDRRAQESKKFEASNESAFLRFSDAPKVDGTKEASKRGAAKPAAPAETGLMGSLMREQPEKPRGRRGPAAGLRRAEPESSGVAGFPGMGERSTPRKAPHLARKPVESNVFPPAIPQWSGQEESAGAKAARAAAAEAAALQAQQSAGANPHYHIDDADYEDRQPASAYSPNGANGRQPPQRMQEIEMYDDDSDDAYVGSHSSAYPQRAAAAAGGVSGGNVPEWLDDPHGAESRPSESPSAQQRRYNFNPHDQQFYEK